MDSSRFEQVREAVLELESLPPDVRFDRLQEICAGDHELRTEIESLLEMEGERAPSVVRTAGAARFLDEPRATGGDPPASEDRIGPYKILGVLGRGGMGEVYLAEQTEPIQREVAIKRIAIGIGHGSVLSRFEQERQVLARMEHPGIARVLDAGADERGRPYFVMEVVRGEPITHYGRDGRLPIAERVDLMERVCRAAHHAHRKGVIHRDLKPSNILVATEDGQLQPKIIDFGIAKSTEEVTAGLTAAGQILGTLSYMSPEQLRGSSDAVDVSSDIYSMGVVLYELLAGKPPYDLIDVPLVDAIRIVMEADPRRTDLKGVDDELFTIVAKAMSKDPKRRYGSADAFADDLTRWQKGLPLLARPESTTYQLRKLVGRHRGLFAVILVVFGLVVAFAITVVIMLQEQRIQRTRAESEARQASEISEFLQTMLASVDPEQMGREVTVRELLDQAALDVGTRLADQPDVLAAVEGTIGVTYRGLGELELAESHLRKALDLTRNETENASDPRLIKPLSNYANLLIGRGNDEEAAPIVDEWLALAEEHHGEEGFETTSALVSLGHLRQLESDYVRAEEVAARVLAIVDAAEQVEGTTPRIQEQRLAGLRVRANAVFMQYRREESRPDYELCLKISRELFGEEHPRTVRMLGNLGLVYGGLGESEKAEETILQSIDIKKRQLGPDHPAIANALANLAFVAKQTGSFDPDSLYKEALRISLAAFGDSHPRTAFLYSALAWNLHSQNRLEEALPMFREYVAARERAHPSGHWEIAYAESGLGDCLSKMGRYEEAETFLVPAYEAIRMDPAGNTKRIISLARVIRLYARMGEKELQARYQAERDSLEAAGWGEWTPPPK